VAFVPAGNAQVAASAVELLTALALDPTMDKPVVVILGRAPGPAADYQQCDATLRFLPPRARILTATDAGELVDVLAAHCQAPPTRLFPAASSLPPAVSAFQAAWKVLGLGPPSACEALAGARNPSISLHTPPSDAAGTHSNRKIHPGLKPRAKLRLRPGPGGQSRLAWGNSIPPEQFFAETLHQDLP
jgi:hypothetical protein